MQNPVKKLREELGLSKREFALATGIGYEELWKSESGYARSLHSQLAQFLRGNGYAGDPEKDYVRWRQELGKAIRSGANDEQSSVAGDTEGVSMTKEARSV